LAAQKYLNVSKKIVKTRMGEDAKLRWNGARGTSEMNYCDFIEKELIFQDPSNLLSEDS